MSYCHVLQDSDELTSSDSLPPPPPPPLPPPIPPVPPPLPPTPPSPLLRDEDVMYIFNEF